MDYEALRRVADEMSDFAEHLEGRWDFEIGRQGIVMMMSPVKRHEGVAYLITRQLEAQLPGTHPGYVAQAGAEVESPALGRKRRPDAVVLPLEILLGAGDTVDPGELLLVVEVVSASNPENDYVDKMADYPAMGIPIYLLVDPRKAVVFVHSDPGPTAHGISYRNTHEYVFGDEVSVGPWNIVTSDFPRYDDPE
jgi:Uma2 family endonuclease